MGCSSLSLLLVLTTPSSIPKYHPAILVPSTAHSGSDQMRDIKENLTSEIIHSSFFLSTSSFHHHGSSQAPFNLLLLLFPFSILSPPPPHLTPRLRPRPRRGVQRAAEIREKRARPHGQCTERCTPGPAPIRFRSLGY